MVLTSDKTLGWYLPELAHPYAKFIEAGHEIEIVSIEGGDTFVTPDSVDMNDVENKKFWETPATKSLTENTKKLADVNAGDYKCIFFVGKFI